MSSEPRVSRWGFLHIRLPLVHMRIEWPEFIQGVVVALSTGLAIVPLLIAYFGLSFEEGVAFCMILSFFIASSILFLGEPYAPGWITPALPLVLAFVLAGYETPTERFQVMSALSIEFALLMFLLGRPGSARN